MIQIQDQKVKQIGEENGFQAISGLPGVDIFHTQAGGGIKTNPINILVSRCTQFWVCPAKGVRVLFGQL